MSDSLQWKVTLRIMAGDKAFGPGVAMVLKGIAADGSLQGAAKRMNMSYSKAWTIIKNAEKIWGFPLTQRHAGGKKGGFSVLTPQAVYILEKYDVMEKSLKATAHKQFQEFFNEKELQRLSHMTIEGD